MIVTVSKVRILLADDHSVTRAGLRFLLERQPNLEIVAEAGDGRQAVELAAAVNPDVAVLDIGMPKLNGIEAARQIAARNPQIAIVMLSMYSDEHYVVRALKAGARAYLLKDASELDLVRAIEAVSEGKSYFSPAISKMLLDDYLRKLNQGEAEDSYESLTTREREILQLLAEGKSNKEVATLLDVSLYTVETHRTHILQKLNLHSIAELVLYAVRRGIVS
jgi:two-component system response regulator NreC